MVDKPASLNDALKDFAKQSPLNDALRDFASTKTTSPSTRSARPLDQLVDFSRSLLRLSSKDKPDTKQPEEPTLPTLSAPAHMKTAFAYVEEMEERLEKPVDHIEAFVQLQKMGLAAQHLAKARSADPGATIVIDTKEGPTPIDQDFLASQILNKEGHLCVISAKTSILEDSNKYLDQAKSAWEQALTYQRRASYHYQLAEVYRLKGDKKAAIASAQQALKLDPDHVPTIQLLDDTRLEWEPAFKPDAPELPPFKEPYKFPMKPHWMVIIAAIVCFLVGFVASSGIFLVIALALGVVGGFAYWKQDPFNQSKIPGTYHHYAQQRSERETRQALGQLYAAQYDEENPDSPNARSGHNRP